MASKNSVPIAILFWWIFGLDLKINWLFILTNFIGLANYNQIYLLKIRDEIELIHFYQND
jgi:hypothetical protein